jgi:hypothetical protein
VCFLFFFFFFFFFFFLAVGKVYFGELRYYNENFFRVE